MTRPRPIACGTKGSSAEYADYAWLVSEEARHLEAAARAGAALHQLAARLRQTLSPLRAHLVLQQAELRCRARVKFKDADHMFFTRVALQQATDQWVAAYKASRFDKGSSVADLCCGIGGDLVALHARGPVTGIDIDPVATLLAGQNLRGARAVMPSGSQLQCADARTAAVADYDAWHIDPDRRPTGRRTTQVAWHEPGPEVIERLLAANPQAAIKLAPAAQPPRDWQQRGELEWISRDRECRQLVAWFGTLAHRPAARSATVLRHPERRPRTLSATTVVDPPLAASVGRYMFEPDVAVRAAGLSGNLAAEHGLAAIDPRSGYLTGQRYVADLAMDAFEVQEVLPLDVKQVASLLRSQNVGRVEIKSRYASVEPDALRRRLRLRGDNAATLLVTPCATQTLAILARRCTDPCATAGEPDAKTATS